MSFLAEGKNLAISFGAKFIETSAGLQHNVDELLVGVLKQIRLRSGLGSASLFEVRLVLGCVCLTQPSTSLLAEVMF